MNSTIVTALAFEQPQPLTQVNLVKLKKLFNKNPIPCFTDIAIINGIKERDAQVIKYLYKKFYKEICSMVKSNSGNQMDAEDLFQDALLVIYQKISGEGLILNSSFNTYLYSICWHLWLQKLSKSEFKHLHLGLPKNEPHDNDSNMEEILEESSNYSIYQQHFLRLSLIEQKVLSLYISRTSCKDVAGIMGYKSEQYAKSRKYLFKEKLKNSILNDPAFIKN
jgi:RNA polymerase sigma factor (sigma-70 family)